jgi:hypothetical protein
MILNAAGPSCGRSKSCAVHLSSYPAGARPAPNGGNGFAALTAEQVNNANMIAIILPDRRMIDRVFMVLLLFSTMAEAVWSSLKTSETDGQGV